MAAANLFEMPERTSNFGQVSLGLMRALPVDVFGVVAVPAKKAKILRESQFDDEVIPATARDAEVFRLTWVVASRIGTPITLYVIDGQKLRRGFATTLTPIPVVSKYNRLAFGCFLSCPCKHGWPAPFIRGIDVLSRLDAAISAYLSFPCFVATLQTETLRDSLFSPCSLVCFHTVCLSSISDVREALNKLQVELMMA